VTALPCLRHDSALAYRHCAARPYAHLVGIIPAFQYQVRKPSAAQVAMQHIAATRPGAWLFARTLHHIDRVLLRLSRGQVTLPGVLAGIPVLTVTTTGARTGQRRPVPLLGVPAAIAAIRGRSAAVHVPKPAHAR
jgi:hypothetical protein